MNIDVDIFSSWTLTVVASTFLGAIIGLHAKSWVPGLNLRDGLRAVSYLTRYDAALEYHGLRRRELRARVDELRANLAESASDGGLHAAIARLGPPRTLAAEVAGGRLVPSWMRGVLWLGGARSARRGDYRVIHGILEEARTVEILHLHRRSDVYRR